MATKSSELVRATGRRKEAVARVRLLPGEGNFHINGDRSLGDYFPNLAVRMVILEPFKVTGRERAFSVFARIEGGGWHGQPGALRQGIAAPILYAVPSSSLL